MQNIKNKTFLLTELIFIHSNLGVYRLLTITFGTTDLYLRPVKGEVISNVMFAVVRKISK